MVKRRVPRWLTGAGLLLLALAATLPVLAQGGYQLRRSVMGAGGQAFLGSGSYRLSGTLGQPVAGLTIAPSGTGVCSGFWWCGGRYKTYLPLAMRNY